MKKIHYVLPGAALLIAGGIPATAQQLPPIRQIGSVVTATTEKLGAVSAVRQLASGSVLVNDIVGRRVLLFDSDLRKFTVVADTTSATGNAYGTRPGGLIQYRGDSTLFVDPASLSMLVIDGNGKIGRVMSVPRANDAQFLIGGPFGSAGFDPQGRLVYRAPPRPVFAGGPPGGGGGVGGGALGSFTPPVIPDSAALVRVDLATRKLDTLAWIRTPRVTLQMSQDANGGVRMQSTLNPLPVVDDWGILPDGTVALVRGKDYHIDWLSPDKVMTSTAKIPFEWQRLSDDDKVAFIDSTRKAMEVARASGNMGGALAGMFGGGGGAQMTIRTGPDGPGASRAEGTRRVPPAGGGEVVTSETVTTAVPAAAGAGAAARTGAAGGSSGGGLPPLNFVPPNELPDYKPPFAGSATRVDPDGNLWIRTSQNVKGLAVYNVVNRKGEVIDRVQLPAGRVIAGFGNGGAVYLASRDEGTVKLEKALAK